MNLITVFQQFPNQQSCIDHLEALRWPMITFCPFCNSERVGRKNERDRLGRWNCHECTNSFNVLTKTIFQGTHIDLQKWFLAIALMADAKKSLSSYQLSRDLELNQKTAWRMQQCIRSAMTSDEGALLQGIIEVDETYVGGKPRYKNKNNKRGRGAQGKTSVVGAIERGGEVKAKVTNDTKGKTLLGFIQQQVEVAKSALVTDDYGAYHNAHKLMPQWLLTTARATSTRTTGVFTPTPSKASGPCLNAPGTAPIIITRGAGCPYLLGKPHGSTITGSAKMGSRRF